MSGAGDRDHGAGLCGILNLRTVNGEDAIRNLGFYLELGSFGEDALQQAIILSVIIGLAYQIFHLSGRDRQRRAARRIDRRGGTRRRADPDAGAAVQLFATPHRQFVARHGGRVCVREEDLVQHQLPQRS